MSNLTDKITKLEEQLAAQDRKLQAKLRNTFIVYAILVIAALIYTSWAIAKLQELTSPKAIGEQLRAYLNQELPSKREILVNKIKTYSQEYTKELAANVHLVVPEVEAAAVQVLDSVTNTIVQSVQEEIMPQFIEFIRKDAVRLKAQYKEIQDPDIGKAIVAIMVESIEKEADDFLNDKMLDSLDDLRVKLTEIKKGDKAISRQADAQRRALIYWSFLAQRSETGSTLWFEMLKAAKKKFDIYFGPDVDEEDEDDPDAVKIIGD